MAIRLIAELAKLTLTSVFKCQGNFDMVVGSQVYYSTIKSCEVFILSFLFFRQQCTVWIGVSFLQSSLHDAVFLVCD